jgi:hypothetical protein
VKRHRDFRRTDLSHLDPRREYISGSPETKGKCACGAETSISVWGVGWICQDCKREHTLRLMHELAAKGANG